MSLPSDTFCALAFVEACVSPRGGVRPCCTYTWGQKHQLGNIFENGTINNSLQTETYKNFRHDLLEGNKPEGCSKCWIDEENNIQSQRQLWNEKYKEDVKELVSKGINKDTFVLKHIETGFGNLCNLSCKMCTPVSSSTFQSIMYPNDKVERIYFGGIEVWEGMDLSNLKYIKLIGGEPMMEPGHISLLEKLSKDTDTSNIILNYFTNTTKKPSSKIIEFWKHFKEIKLTHSIDSTHDIQLYQRPGNYKWQDIEDTLDYYFSLSDINISHTISSVVTPITIMKLKELFDWVNNKFIDKEVFLSLNPTIRPYWSNIQNLDEQMKNSANKLLDTLIKGDLENHESLVRIKDHLNKAPVKDTINLDNIFNDHKVKTITNYYSHNNIEEKIRELY